MRRLGSLIVLTSVALACAAGPRAATQLVSRADALPDAACGAEQCRWWQPEMTFRDARGSIATMAASRRSARYELVQTPEVACGASSHTRGTYRYRLDFLDLPAVADPVVGLSFDDGSTIRLFPEEMITVRDRCVDETGRWEGVTGTYQGRRGTYRFVWERLQTELTLTDTAV